MISSITSLGFLFFFEENVPRYFAARIKVFNGVVTITAPMVPPSTIMSAVT